MQYGRQVPYAHVRPLPHWLEVVHWLFTAAAPAFTHETAPVVLLVMSHVCVAVHPHCGSSPHALEGAVVTHVPPLLEPLAPLEVPDEPPEVPEVPLEAPLDPELDVPPSPLAPLDVPLDPEAPDDDAPLDPLELLLGGSGWLAGGSVGSFVTSFSFSSMYVFGLVAQAMSNAEAASVVRRPAWRTVQDCIGPGFYYPRAPDKTQP